MQTHFTTSTQTQSVWCDHHRNARIAHAHNASLEVSDSKVQLFPFPLGSEHEDHGQICTRAELSPLIPNDQPFV